MDSSKVPGLDPKVNVGKSPEVSTDGRPINMPGVYRHVKTGAEIITAPLTDKGEGIVQADAIVRTGGYERVGDVPTRSEILAMNKAQEIKDAAAEALQKGREAEELKAAVKKATEDAKAEAAAKAEPVAV